MITLVELERVLGGVIRVTRGCHWLDTTMGDLRAVVIRRVDNHSRATRYDLVVFTPSARELDPFEPRRCYAAPDGSASATWSPLQG